MNNSGDSIEALFFQLVQVALDFRKCLSRTPLEEEWGILFILSKQQSMMGICFAAIQKLQLQKQVPPNKLYLEWMGIAAKIQQRNKAMDMQCIKLYNKLATDGYRSCILKGQGAATLYCDGLRELRQAGDIDVWVEGDFDKVIDWVKRYAPVEKINDHHVSMPLFSDTPVEVHFNVGSLLNKRKNTIFQKWISNHSKAQFSNFDDMHSYCIPTLEFNCVYMLSHMHKHVFMEGLGLRQIMDYYFLMQECKRKKVNFNPIKEDICNLGLESFARALAWVEQKVFGQGVMSEIWRTDDNRGSFILEDILRGGNFGKHDSKYSLTPGAPHIYRFGQKIYASCRYLRYFPSESLWCVIDYFCSFLLLKKLKYC